MGNQLTTDKIRQVNLLDPLPFEEPEEPTIEEVEVVDEEVISKSEGSDDEKPEDDGQIALF